MTTNARAMMVEHVSFATPDIMVVDLVAPTGEMVPAWEPGAHVDIHLPSGKVRQYSLCGDPKDRSRYVLGILREEAGRGGSAEAHQILRPDFELPVAGPRNHFPLVDADEYVFVGGGIGITPLLPMVRQLQAAGKEWRLVYGGRSLATMAFREAVGAFPASSVTLVPQDTAGLIDLSAIVDAAGDRTAIYACGPGPMLNAIQDLAAKAGKSPQLHIERFSADGLAAPEGDEVPVAFDVELRASGVTLHVPADRSMRDVLLEAGINVPFSCEEGYCGSCETAVLEGTPEHHDVVLTPEERASNKTMCVCVGRSRSAKLVLDI